MSNADREEQMLERARRALSPTAADADRVLDSTRRVIAAAAAGAGAAHSATYAAQSAPIAAATLRRFVQRLIAALAIAGASSGAGYYVGYRAGRESVSPPVVMPRAPAQTAMRAPDATPAPPSQIANPNPVPFAHTETESTPSRVTERSAAPRAEATQPAREAAQSLEREVQMMKRIEHALREGNPQQALVLLGQLDREIPGGQLAEERLAVFALARCGLGLGSPAAVAREFAQKYPKSVYFARVRQTCAAGEDPRVPLD